MSQELLSICVPTYGRAKYLKAMLDAFAVQVKRDNITPEQVTFYISDNCSPDETPQVIDEFARNVPQLVRVRNEKNIGGDNNIFFVRTLGKGKYIWVAGDDELVCDHALANVLRLLREHSPGLVIAYNSKRYYSRRLQE